MIYTLFLRVLIINLFFIIIGRIKIRNQTNFLLSFLRGIFSIINIPLLLLWQFIVGGLYYNLLYIYSIHLNNSYFIYFIILFFINIVFIFVRFLSKGKSNEYNLLKIILMSAILYLINAIGFLYFANLIFIKL